MNATGEAFGEVEVRIPDNRHSGFPASTVFKEPCDNLLRPVTKQGLIINPTISRSVTLPKRQELSAPGEAGVWIVGTRRWPLRKLREQSLIESSEFAAVGFCRSEYQVIGEIRFSLPEKIQCRSHLVRIVKAEC